MQELQTEVAAIVERLNATYGVTEGREGHARTFISHVRTCTPHDAYTQPVLICLCLFYHVSQPPPACKGEKKKTRYSFVSFSLKLPD